MCAALRCLSLSTLALLPLLLGAEAVPMFPNSGSEGNELYSVVDQFLKSRSSSSSGNVAHTGLPHEHAGEHGAAQLPQAPNAVSGHPLANPDDSWMDYFNDVVTEDNSKLYQRLGHEGQSLPVASWREYMQHPQDINRGVAGWSEPLPAHAYPGALHAHPQPHMLQGIEPFPYLPGEIGNPSPSAPDTYHAHPQPHMLQGIEPSSYEPWTLNKPSPNAPGTLHARPQPYMLQGTEPSSYVPRKKSRPSPSAPGSSKLPIHAPGTSSKQRVTASTANVVDSRVATDPDPSAALSMENDPKRLYVGPYPRPSLEQEQKFLTTKGHQLFSDENLGKLEVKGRKYLIQDSDKDLDRWLLRVLGLRQQLLLQRNRDATIILFSLEKDPPGSRLINANVARSSLKLSFKGPFEPFKDVLADFNVGEFTFHVKKLGGVGDNGRRVLAFRTTNHEDRKLYFGRLKWEIVRQKVSGPEGERMEVNEDGMRAWEERKIKIFYP